MKRALVATCCFRTMKKRRENVVIKLIEISYSNFVWYRSNERIILHLNDWLIRRIESRSLSFLHSSVPSLSFSLHLKAESAGWIRFDYLVNHIALMEDAGQEGTSFSLNMCSGRAQWRFEHFRLLDNNSSVSLILFIFLVFSRIDNFVKERKKKEKKRKKAIFSKD